MKKVIATLSFKSLLKARLEFFCNLALILGVVVPLLTLLGAKNGINDGLISRLTERAGLLDIRTMGNDFVVADAIDVIAEIDGVAFASLMVRSGTDFMIANRPNGGPFVNLRLRVTGPNDPLLSDLPEPELDTVLITAEAAQRLQLAIGDSFEASTDNDGRTRHAITTLTVAGILPDDRLVGQVMLVPLAFMEALEAYTEGYAVPSLGITDGLDLSGRVQSYEGVQVTVKNLYDVGPVSQEMSNILNRKMRSEEQAIADTLATRAYLDRAFQLIAVIGGVGVVAALAAAQVNAVRQQRRSLATLLLLGSSKRDIAVFPVIPAFVTVLSGLLLSLIGYAILVQIVGQFSETAVLALRLRPTDLLMACVLALCVATVACLFAIRTLMKVDPAIILRDTI